MLNRPAAKTDGIENIGSVDIIQLNHGNFLFREKFRKYIIYQPQYSS